MSRLIQKSGYIKPGKASGYMKYIATRERVEILKPDASSDEAQDRSGYLRYMGLRPRAERHGEHGLFSSGAPVSMDTALREVDAHEGNVWTLIYSLRRADAVHLGYDHAKDWQTLLTGKQAELAAALKIQPDHLRWYAAFHDEGDHPHIHVMAWSSDPPEGYLSKDALLKLQSKLTNEIFHGELQELYVKKDVRYKELTAAAREAMGRLVRQLEYTETNSAAIEQKMAALARALEAVKGKKVYGYLKKPLKAQVDEIVDALAELPEVAACCAEWNRLKDELDGYYHDEVQREHRPLSQQKEFRAIKNMVIREAENLRLSLQAGEDTERRHAQTAVDSARERYAALSVMRLLHHLSQIFRETPPPANPAGSRVDSKRRRKLLKKRLALGHRIDDHEDALNNKYQYPTHTM